jgi:magnesium transporter
MQKYIISRAQKRGLPPGSLVHIGEKKRDKTKIAVMEFDEDSLNEYEIENREDINFDSDNQKIKWLNIEGLHDTELLGEIGKRFNLHPLIIEDILNTDQRPKIEINNDYIYFTVKTLLYDNKTYEFNIEQQSIVFSKNYVLSFGETDTDLYQPIIDRIRNKIGRIRGEGTDYLAYALLDIIVDNYFEVLEGLGEKIEDIEDQMVVKVNPETLKTIHSLKRQVLFLHKSVWPLREVLSPLERQDSLLVQDSTQIYLRDLYDHTVQVMDTTETLRDILAGMLDIYLSSSSNRMNEIMKVLTIISTVFMPLSFIVGIYGMNIVNMPELTWKWMYPTLWAVMITITILMLTYFKKKKWW